MPLSEKFQFQVFKEVLSCIRKHGEHEIKEKYINKIEYFKKMADISGKLIDEQSNLINTQYNFIEILKPNVVL